MRKSPLTFGPRRGVYIDARDLLDDQAPPLAADDVARLEGFDLVYRSLCALLYNYVPMSGHPGGSISSGRFVQALLFHTMRLRPRGSGPRGRGPRSRTQPATRRSGSTRCGRCATRSRASQRRSCCRRTPRSQLRLEDLLGFRRNPTNATPLFLQFRAKALDGHPTPATPFLRLSTGASGVGVATSLGLAFGGSRHLRRATRRACTSSKAKAA